MQAEVTRPFEVDVNEYPFADHWLDYRGSALHYLDVGSGPPVVLLHGNPTWSYLYRNVIKDLQGECRLIAPDYPGFGMSRSPDGYGFTPREHAEAVEALIDKLGLENVTLVLQDWGGPIGMSYAVGHPENIRALVIMNTWVFQPDLIGRVFSLAMGGWPLGKLLQTQANFFAKVIVPNSIHHKEKVTDSLKNAYLAPFATPESRLPTWVFPREIVRSAPWLKSIEVRLAKLRDTPVQFLWAKKDPAFGKEKVLQAWKRHLDNHETEHLDDASHYLQEDRPDRVAAAIRRALERSS